MLDYLNSALAVPAYMEVPADTASEFIVLDKTGSGESDHVQRATIAVQSIGPSLLRAAEINDSVITAMRGIASLPDVSGCYLNSDYNYTDTETKRYRYQAVFDIYY